MRCSMPQAVFLYWTDCLLKGRRLHSTNAGLSRSMTFSDQQCWAVCVGDARIIQLTRSPWLKAYGRTSVPSQNKPDEAMNYEHIATAVFVIPTSVPSA